MKKIICMILCLSVLFTLAACGATDENKETTPTETTTPVETKPADEIYRDGSAEAAAQKFIKSILRADYATTLKCFDLPDETPYLTPADIEWYIPRSNYADLLDLTFTDYDVLVEKEYASNEVVKCKITIQDKNSTATKKFTVNLHLNKSNKWGVEDTGFYFAEYYLAVPGGKTTVKLDDNVVSEAEKYGKYGQSNLKDLYKLTYVGKSEKTFKISSETYDTITVTLYPEANSEKEPHEIFAYYNDSKAYQYVGRIWESYYSAVLSSLPANELTHTISPTADEKTAETILTAMNVMINKDVCSDYNLFNIKACSSKSLQSEYLASDKILLHFNYALSWVDNSNPESAQSYTMNYCDSIILNYANGSFTIHGTVNKNNVFNYKNAETNEQK